MNRDHLECHSESCGFHCEEFHIVRQKHWSLKGSVEEIAIGFSRLWFASCGVAYTVLLPENGFI
jgi:hypothetical protein